jgi:putative membrane protein
MSYIELPSGSNNEGEKYKIHREMIYRHLAYINALRLQLRMPTTFSIKPKGRVKSMMAGSPQEKHWNEEVGTFLNHSEYGCVSKRQNTATQIIRKQGDHLTRLKNSGWIDDFRHMELMKILEEFYNLQGKAERIKKTPFPRQYAYFSKLFTWIFLLLLPFGMVGQFAAIGHSTVYMTIPFSVIISWIFFTMEAVGDSSEDPFEGFINDVPMSSLCRIIEIDMRDMLFETEIPEQIKPVKNVLL